MVLARTVNGTAGSLNQRTGQFVPAVISKDSPDAIDMLTQATGLAHKIVPFVNLGVGVFNGVMSWKMNKKLDHLIASVDELALRQELEFRQVHESLGRIELAISESHREMEVKDLERLQYRVVDIARAVQATEARHDAERLIEVAGELAAHPRPNLERLGVGAVERFPYVIARVQGMVAEADARYLLAEITRQPRQAFHAAEIRDQARRFVTSEMHDSLRENSVKELLEPELLVPMAYWYAVQGLDTSHLLTDGASIVEGQIVWDAPLLETLRTELRRARPSTYRIAPGAAIAEFLDDSDGWDSLMAFQGISGMPDHVLVPPPREVLAFVGLHGQVVTHAHVAAKVVRSYEGWLRVRELWDTTLSAEEKATLPPATMEPNPTTSRRVELDWTGRIEAGLESLRNEDVPDPGTWARALHLDAATFLEPQDPRLREIAARGLLLAVEAGDTQHVADLQIVMEDAPRDGQACALAQLALGRADLAQGMAQDAVLTLGALLEGDREGDALGRDLSARRTPGQLRTALIEPALEAARQAQEAGVPQAYYRAIRAHAWATPSDELECRFYEELNRIENDQGNRRRGHATEDLRRQLKRAAAPGSGVPAQVLKAMESALAGLEG
jgi:GNAT superfamily N-acetyltransferase